MAGTTITVTKTGTNSNPVAVLSSSSVSDLAVGDTLTFFNSSTLTLGVSGLDSTKWVSASDSFHGPGAQRTLTVKAGVTGGSDTLYLDYGEDYTSFAASFATPDLTPDSFNVGADVTGAAISTNYQSGTITVAGLSAGYSVSLSVTNGQYSKNGGGYTSSSTTVVNGDTVVFRVTSSASYSTAVIGTLNIGGVTDSRTITTAAGDGTPNSFDIGSNVLLASISTNYFSGTITVSGINIPVTISCSKGAYSKNGGAYTTSSGTVVNGDTIVFRITSSSAFNTLTTGSLTIGGVNDTRDITTGNPDTTPDTFNIGSNVSNATLSTAYYSGTITVSGLSSGYSTSMTTSNGQYSKNGGGYSSSATNVVNGDTVVFKITSSASYSTGVTGTLTIGGVSDARIITTGAAPDDTPDSFNIGADVTNAPLSTDYFSGTITVSGMNTTASVSVLNGSYSKNGGGYTNSSGTAVNGDTFVFKMTSSNVGATLKTGVLNIGGTSDTRQVTTRAVDITPNTFNLGTNLTNADLSTWYTFNTITVAGLDAGVTVAAQAAHTYTNYAKMSVNGAAYTTGQVNVENGDTIAFQAKSSYAYSEVVTAELYVGAVSDSVNITTLTPDSTPTSFSIGADVTNAPTNVNYFSDTITVSGLTAGYGVDISVNGGMYSLNGAIYTSTTGYGVVLNGSTVVFRMASSLSFGTITSGTLTIGTLSDTRQITTVAEDNVPTQFNIGADLTEAQLNAVYTSSFTVAGINTGVDAVITNGVYSIDGGSYSAQTRPVYAGNLISVKITTPNTHGSSITGTLTIGGVSDSRTITTVGYEYMQSTPPISLLDIRTFFSGVSYNLHDYYRGGAYVPDISENLGITNQITGDISLLDFLNAAKPGSPSS